MKKHQLNNSFSNMFQFIKTNRCKNEEAMNPLPCFGMEEDLKEIDT